MQINIDTTKINGWLLGHLSWVIPAGLLAGSWFAALRTSGETFIGVWWGFLSIIALVGSVLTTILGIMDVVDELDKKRKYR